MRASELADQLRTRLGDFSTQRDDLKKRLEEQNKRLQDVREKLSNIDDLSGSDEDLVERLQIVQVNTHKVKVFLKAFHALCLCGCLSKQEKILGLAVSGDACVVCDSKVVFSDV